MSQQCKAEQKQEKISQILLADLIEPSADKKTVSLPLQFQFLPVQLLSKEFTKLNNNHEYRIHYLGPRFHNTLTIHKKFGYCEKTPHEIASLLQEKQPINRYRVDTRKIIESYFVQEKLRGNTFYKSNLFYRAFEGMNPTLTLEKEFVFNSIFQSGNLDCVIKVKQREFDLFLRIDSNTKGHVQWFYFSVKNGSRKEKIKFNICNLSKAKSLYESGMQPYVFSKERIRQHGGDWEQRGVNLGLSKKELRYDYLDQKIPNFNYYCLELEYEFEYDNDEVFFAYCVPYTFSRLSHEINKLPQQYTHRSVLGKTLAGIDIPILHITNHQRLKQKKNILITGRMHPGEPNSSHMLQGFIQFLNSSSKQAVEMRNRINFFIIPMVNPDGVIIGNTRTSAAGKDLNRQFLLANRDLYPEVALIKQFARKLHNLHGVFMYLDFHGHSRKKNTFFYGPAYTISEPNYYKCRILPKLVQKVNSNFRFHSCSFGIDEQKKQTARAIMFQHFKINFTYTIETSIGFFYDCQNLKTVSFNHEEWKKMGGSIADGLFKFIVGFEEYEEILKERRASRQKKRPPTSNKYMLTEYKLEADEQLGIFKRAEPLKIVYNDKSLFGSVIDELKIIKSNNYIKQIDDDCDSDAHDDRQDFQVSKMKEFNNLLTDIAHREKPRNHHIITREPKTERHKIRSESLENLQQELRFFEEMEAMQKPSTTQGHRESVENATNLKKTIRRQLKNSMDIKKTQAYRTTILNNTFNRQKKDKADVKILNRSLEKKMVSECELNNDRGNDKISYFGQYHLFVDKSEAEKSKVTANFQRNSLFRREKSKKSKRSGISHIEQSRFLSQSYLEKPGSKHLLYENQTTQMNYLGGHSVAKPNNYEFKFDEIQTALVAKEKLKDYLRTKINRSNRSNVIGPASFYGIRQNINLKLNNKRKFFEEKSTQSNKESLKVIKFT